MSLVVITIVKIYVKNGRFIRGSLMEPILFVTRFERKVFLPVMNIINQNTTV